jgi:hypothetical protein
MSNFGERRRKQGQRRRSSTGTETVGFPASPLAGRVAAANGRLPDAKPPPGRALSVREIVPDKNPKPKPW